MAKTIEKGSYLLTITSDEAIALAGGSTSAWVSGTFTTMMGSEEYTCNAIEIDYMGEFWDVYYNEANMNIMEWIATGTPDSQSYFSSSNSRLIHFVNDVTVADDVYNVFSALFKPINEYTNATASNLADLVNMLIQEGADKALDKLAKCKPYITTIYNNSAGTQSISSSWISNADLLFMRANARSSNTPLCYVIPSSLMFAASSSGFNFQVADSTRYSIFKFTNGKVEYSSGNSGKIFQLYALNYPRTVV